MAKAIPGRCTMNILDLNPITDVPGHEDIIYQNLIESIQRNGLMNIPYVDEDWNVVTGRLSVLAARAVGQTHITVFVLPRLTKVHRLNMRFDHERGLGVVEIARKYQKSVPLTRKILNGAD